MDMELLMGMYCFFIPYFGNMNILPIPAWSGGMYVPSLRDDHSENRAISLLKFAQIVVWFPIFITFFC
jgi:hypothetical protein